MNEKPTEIVSDAPNRYPPWAPRIWSGFLPLQYLSYLAENHFSIHPTRYPMTFMLGVCSAFNTLFATVQKLGWSKRIAQQEIKEPPIFIVGHWRSGTTLLHELMSLDKNLAFPSNYDTFVPSHFLASGPLVRPLFRCLLPNKRPMDNMTVDVDSPQEDDFALTIMGAASHYRRMGFPQNRNEYFRWLDAQNLEEAERQNLRDCLKYFYRALTYKYQKRLLLKSPPHTGRLRYLADWFPGAKFVHISRHPYSVVPSTMRLWMITDDVHAFHPRQYSQAALLNYVNVCQQELYEAYFRDREEIDPSQIVEIRYEDLVAEPVGTIEKIYGKLNLQGFAAVAETTRGYFESKRDHKQNRHNADSIANIIDGHWEKYIAAFYSQ